jgi:lupus La protein
MWSLHSKTDDHWIPISTIASFKRMRQYLPRGIPWIADVLRTSSSLEVDEAGENVRRKEEVKPPSGQFERSVYAKGFGEEVDGLQLELEEFLRKYGPINAVRMRRTDAKAFKVPYTLPCHFMYALTYGRLGLGVLRVHQHGIR